MMNVTPTNDLKEHVNGTTCPCHPKIIEHCGEMIVVHNAYDGREFKEQMIDVLKKQIKLDDLIDLLPKT